jgi:hypothetical protein
MVDAEPQPYERRERAKLAAYQQYRKEIEAYSIDFLDFYSDPSTLVAERVQDCIGKYAGRVFQAELRYGQSLENTPEAMEHGLWNDLDPEAIIRRAWDETHSLAFARWQQYFTPFRRGRSRALGPQSELDARLAKRYLNTIMASLMPILKEERRRYRLGAKPAVEESKSGPTKPRETEGHPQIDEANGEDEEHEGHGAAPSVDGDAQGQSLPQEEAWADDPIAYERQAFLRRHKSAFLAANGKILSDDQLGRRCGWSGRSYIARWKKNLRGSQAYDLKIRSILRGVNPTLREPE